MESQRIISKSVTLLEDENILLIYRDERLATLKLEPQLTAILVTLLNSKNTIVTKEEFITSIWANNGFVGQTALRKNIYKLRQLLKVNDLENELKITTVPKRGYKLSIIEEKVKTHPIRVKKIATQMAYVAIAAIILLFLAFGYTEEEDIILQAPLSETEIILSQN